MFERFPPSIRATIEAFFNDLRFGETHDDLALDLANELELQHPDLKIADPERIAQEAVEERSAAFTALRVSQPLPSPPTSSTASSSPRTRPSPPLA